MPAPKPGQFVAAAIRKHLDGSKSVIVSVRVNGFRRAYFVAQLLALLADIKTPKSDPDGIDWAICVPVPIKTDDGESGEIDWNGHRLDQMEFSTWVLIVCLILGALALAGFLFGNILAFIIV